MFGFLGWLFGAGFVSAIASFLSVLLMKALMPELVALRMAVTAAIWGTAMSGLGGIGFKRTARRWRRKGSFVSGLIDVPDERRR